MLFMAGIDRTFSTGAKIGVHSAHDSRMDVETPAALEATMAMVRKVQTYGGTPHSVIGKIAGTHASNMAWLSRGELHEIGATLYPPEPAPPHTPALIDEARNFAKRYLIEEPGYAASYGGEDGIVRRWLESYDYAYSTGASAGTCGNGYMPDTDACVAGARDYAASLRSAGVP